jgi:hypothetical protein
MKSCQCGKSIWKPNKQEETELGKQTSKVWNAKGDCEYSLKSIWDITVETQCGAHVWEGKYRSHKRIHPFVSPMFMEFVFE